MLNTKNRMLCKWPSTVLRSVRMWQQCSQRCSYGYVDLLALCHAWESTFSGDRFIHLRHADRLKSLGLAIWQQVDCPLFWMPRVVPCTPPCCTHLNKWYNLFDQAGKLIVKLLQRRRSNQGGQRTVFILIAAVAFSPQTRIQSCRILNSTITVSTTELHPRWPWQPRRLPPSSADAGSAAEGWCWSATSASREGPLRRNNKAPVKRTASSGCSWRKRQVTTVHRCLV